MLTEPSTTPNTARNQMIAAIRANMPDWYPLQALLETRADGRAYRDDRDQREPDRVDGLSGAVCRRGREQRQRQPERRGNHDRRLELRRRLHARADRERRLRGGRAAGRAAAVHDPDVGQRHAARRPVPGLLLRVAAVVERRLSSAEGCPVLAAWPVTPHRF